MRNSRGEEGYVPALSCLLPTPDFNANNAVERSVSCPSQLEFYTQRQASRSVMSDVNVTVNSRSIQRISAKPLMRCVC